MNDIGVQRPIGHVGNVVDFCTVVDHVTFGIRDGKTFALMSKDWTPDQRLEWAKAQVQFFQGLVDRINNWGAHVAHENGLDY